MSREREHLDVSQLTYVSNDYSIGVSVGSAIDALDLLCPLTSCVRVYRRTIIVATINNPFFITKEIMNYSLTIMCSVFLNKLSSKLSDLFQPEIDACCSTSSTQMDSSNKVRMNHIHIDQYVEESFQDIALMMY